MNRARAPAVDAKVSRLYSRNYLRLVYTLHLIVLKDKGAKGHFEITPSNYHVGSIVDLFFVICEWSLCIHFI